MEDPHASPGTDPRLLRLAPDDNVAVAKTNLEPGQSLTIAGVSIVLSWAVPTGHKLALAPIAAGEKVVKHGAPIGSATAEIRPGDYVHTHNLKSDYLPTYSLQGNDSYLGKQGF